MRDEKVDASGDAGLSPDKAVSFEAAHHMMDRRWADTEMALHVGFGGGLAEHALVDTDEGQVVALLFGEAMRAVLARGA